MASSGETVTWGDLERGSNQLAHLFRNHGLQRGDHIAICLENHRLFLTICWAAFRSGLYFTAISYRLQPAEVEYIVNDCRAKLLVTSALLTDTFLGFADKLENDPICYMLDGVCKGATSLEKAIKGLPETPIIDQSYGQSMLYSSGTTGRPKGVKKPMIELQWGEESPLLKAAESRYEYNRNTIYLSSYLIDVIIIHIDCFVKHF